MGKDITLKITATEANWAHGNEVDAREALATLEESVSGLLELADFATGLAEITLSTEDMVWNEGTDDEAVVEPYVYTFTIKEVSDGY